MLLNLRLCVCINEIVLNEKYIQKIIIIAPKNI